MKFTTLIILIVCFYVAIASKISDEFPQKSEKCFQQERVPQDLKASFQSFQYPNRDIVHKYIHCVSTELDIWDNTNGFNVEKISQQYRGRANDELVIPVISKCNLDNQNRNKELWCYRSFLCILNTQVGDWFKEDVRRRQPANIPNGHH
ncbi:general odorant-binding protein 99a-like [Lucilia cuprina]|uniref:general odorant-binding protein 99a-like n=1 Tax=Lucilia cuprina TaxID=7375 RepID=UPI001F05F6B2|nr:general odorant-binding protein 99a-like [Lucilia cuprina]